jgi:hypothetical protein
MPIPQYSTTLFSVPLAPGDDPGQCVTELRVHGISGTPANALLADLAPVHVWGDSAAGFYRSSKNQATGRDVEAYSWGGLTSGSSYRVLWLVLLPFLFGNLSGWLCSRVTRDSPVRFAFHRMCCGLGALALTVNTAFVTLLITADVAGYQAVRAGRVPDSWWLAPMGWPTIAGHPARQVTVGVLAAALVLAGIHLLVGKSWRYERVRPPLADGREPAEPARPVTAAALPGGLLNKNFWDGARSVRLLAWVHAGAFAGFLAIALAVTARALSNAGNPGHASDLPLFWTGAGAGGIALGAAAAYLVADAIAGSREVPALRAVPVVLPFAALVGLACAGAFAWLQPAGLAAVARTAPVNLPGLAGIVTWTVCGLVTSVALVGVSVLIGLDRNWRQTLVGGPLVSLLLGFGILNVTLLCLQVWIAHLAGPVTSTASLAVRQHALYVPFLVQYGAPMLAWAIVVAAALFAVTELTRWLLAAAPPAAMKTAYAADFRRELTRRHGPARRWYSSALGSGGDSRNHGWERGLARGLLLGRIAHDAAWLLWGIAVFQLATGLAEWRWKLVPPVAVRDAGMVLAAFIVPALMAYVRSAWSDVTKRRSIGVLWDVGTFWPRSFHPFAPPCYAEQAIPDLQRRIWWLHDNGGQVVVVAHSQGSIMATAALAQAVCRTDHGPTALVTFGNPTTWLYAWGFPGYIRPELLSPLVQGHDCRLLLWRNYVYPTDPIGYAPVAGLLPDAHRDIDEELLDPATCGYVYGNAAQGPTGHSGYWRDARVWAGIDRAAASLTTPVTVPAPASP